MMVDTTIYRNKQLQMSHRFHASTSGVPSGSLGVTDMDSIQTWSQWQDTHSLICPVIGGAFRMILHRRGGSGSNTGPTDLRGL